MNLFISYSHKDEEWKDRVVGHLNILQQEGVLAIWNDRKIIVGDEWDPEIEAAINKADGAILLISINFLNSEYIRKKEIPCLLEKKEPCLVAPSFSRLEGPY